MQFSAIFIAAAATLVSAAGNITHGAANATVTQVGVVTANKTIQVTVTSCKDDACHKTSTPAVVVPVPVQNGTVSNHTTAANHTHGAKPSPSQAEGTHTGSVALANGAQALGFSAVVAGVAAAALLI